MRISDNEYLDWVKDTCARRHSIFTYDASYDPELQEDLDKINRLPSFGNLLHNISPKHYPGVEQEDIDDPFFGGCYYFLLDGEYYKFTCVNGMGGDEIVEKIPSLPENAVAGTLR